MGGWVGGCVGGWLDGWAVERVSDLRARSLLNIFPSKVQTEEIWCAALAAQCGQGRYSAPDERPRGEWGLRRASVQTNRVRAGRRRQPASLRAVDHDHDHVRDRIKPHDHEWVHIFEALEARGLLPRTAVAMLRDDTTVQVISSTSQRDPLRVVDRRQRGRPWARESQPGLGRGSQPRGTGAAGAGAADARPP